MKQSQSLKLGRFALRALAGGDETGEQYLPARVVRAMRYYLRDSGSGRVGWPCPDFLAGSPKEELETMELEIEPRLSASFEAEAARQKVDVNRLANHAVLYYVADRDAGRVTQRIIDDLDGAE